MAHYRKPLAAAAALNTAIFVVEAVAGFKADSLSLIMDSVHTLSDEMALVFLHPAARNRSVALGQCLQLGRPGARQWAAAVASGRANTPSRPRRGLGRHGGRPPRRRSQLGRRRLLLAPSRNNAAIRLAYIHNIGDVYVSLAPVAAGLLVSLTSYSIFDPLIAAGIAVGIIASTVREVFASSEELIWPEKIVCGHSDHEEAAIGAAPSQP
jgi:cobalt-zinc-cadmium efflux system protein